MAPKEQKSKEQKALAAANSSKGKRKKWSKGKNKEKVRISPLAHQRMDMVHNSGRTAWHQLRAVTAQQLSQRLRSYTLDPGTRNIAQNSTHFTARCRCPESITSWGPWVGVDTGTFLSDSSSRRAVH